MLNGLGDGDLVSPKNSSRLGLNTDSVTTESGCTPQMAGTSAKVTEGWGEMDLGANSCSSGGSLSTITSVMPSMRDAWSPVGLLFVTVPLWGLVKTASEVGRAACFATLAKSAFAYQNPIYQGCLHILAFQTNILRGLDTALRKGMWLSSLPYLHEKRRFDELNVKERG